MYARPLPKEYATPYAEDISSATSGGGEPYLGPLFTTQPIQACYPELGHTYTVETSSGDASPVTLHWQELFEGTWTDILGETLPTFAPALIYPDKDGVKIRCEATNASGVRASTVVTICYTGFVIGILTEDGNDTVLEDGTTEIISERL